jgi:hypothetical protein
MTKNKLFNFVHNFFNLDKLTNKRKQNSNFYFTQVSHHQPQIAEGISSINYQPVKVFSYDVDLLERSTTKWQFGDWQSLCQLKLDMIENHPDRAKLAIFGAAGMLQTGQNAEAKENIKLAKAWGASKNLIDRILIAGVHNSLGRAAALLGNQPNSIEHFHSALATAFPSSETTLLSQARISNEYQNLGLSPIAVGSITNIIQKKITLIK